MVKKPNNFAREHTRHADKSTTRQAPNTVRLLFPSSSGSGDRSTSSSGSRSSTPSHTSVQELQVQVNRQTNALEDMQDRIQVVTDNQEGMRTALSQIQGNLQIVLEQTSPSDSE
jgi:hypothetical protein